MIVEPSSLRPRSPFRRLLRRAGFVAPAVLLAGVAAAGIAGPKPAPSASPLRTAATSLPPSSIESTAAPTGLPAPTVPAVGVVRFPEGYLTLPAMHPSEVLAARSSPAGAPLVLAVAGYLGNVGIVPDCPGARTAAGAWCERSAVLADAPFGGPGTVGGFAPHLHVVIPPGVTLPPASASDARPGPVWLPVEALGRFTVPGQCGGSLPSCEHGFVVERIVWADGSPSAVIPLVQPGLGRQAPPVPTAVAASPMLLVAVLVRPGAIASLDQRAAAAARLQPGAAPVWYVRYLGDLDNDGPDEPVVRWAIVEPKSGAPVASGPSTLPTVGAAASPVGAGASPALVTGP